MNPARANRRSRERSRSIPRDPLPRLGLGLARIRRGDLEQGRQEIETAASLDPGQLGGAELSRQGVLRGAAEQAGQRGVCPRESARPNGSHRLLLRRDREADDQSAGGGAAGHAAGHRAEQQPRGVPFELAVDSDLAARSASLARIYGDLGFQQLALVEGWKSVNTDPTNFSAHRFLADSYSILPRHEIARVSELLQSQLLQPLNVTPIQPRLAEANLFLLGAQGPTVLGFNEFNPLFGATDHIPGERPRWRERDLCRRGRARGIFGMASAASAGLISRRTGGGRMRTSRTVSRMRSSQLALTPRTSVQAEFRYRKSETGDLQLNFFPDDFRSIFANRRGDHVPARLAA